MFGKGSNQDQASFGHFQRIWPAGKSNSISLLILELIEVGCSF